VLERGHDLCRARAVGYWLPVICASLGLAYATDGRTAEAFPLLEQALERLRAAQMMIYQSLFLTSLSETHVLAGRTDDATQCAAEALRVHRDPLDVGEAEPRYQQALALATDLGMRPLVAHCHAGLAKLYRRTGKDHLTKEHFTSATTMYRDMGMTYWLEKAEAEMAALR
jgi:tetratricopeptide (TPR) repeat protein